MNSSGIIFCTILIGEKVAELKNSKLFVWFIALVFWDCCFRKIALIATEKNRY